MHVSHDVLDRSPFRPDEVRLMPVFFDPEIGPGADDVAAFTAGLTEKVVPMQSAAAGTVHRMMEFAEHLDTVCPRRRMRPAVTLLLVGHFGIM